MSKPSKYEQIWKLIKRDGHCAISCAVPLQPRIIKAVIKRKDKDTGYKFLLGENKQYAKLYYTKESARIRFFIRIFDRVKDININDL